jgi:hypothetical protein
MDWLEQRGKEMDARLNASPLTEEEQAQRLATNESTVTFVPAKREARIVTDTPPPDEALRELLSLPEDQRGRAVSLDIRSAAPRYSGVKPHDLAEALGIDDASRPGGDWTFIRYAKIGSIEEYAQFCTPASEHLYLLSDLVDPERFAQLLEHSDALDASDEPSFAFLTPGEREQLETAIGDKELEAHASNGMNCMARNSVQGSPGVILEFEADIEDDGTCIELRTPYDKAKGLFRDLSGCHTSGC